MTETNSEHGSDDTDILLDALNPLIEQSEKLFAESGIVTYASSQNRNNIYGDNLQSSAASQQLTAMRQEICTSGNQNSNNRKLNLVTSPQQEQSYSQSQSQRKSPGKPVQPHNITLGYNSGVNNDPNIPDSIDSSVIVKPLLEAQRIHRNLTSKQTNSQTHLLTTLQDPSPLESSTLPILRSQQNNMQTLSLTTPTQKEISNGKLSDSISCRSQHHHSKSTILSDELSSLGSSRKSTSQQNTSQSFFDHQPKSTSSSQEATPRIDSSNQSSERSLQSTSRASIDYQPKSTSTSQEATPRGDFNQLSSRSQESHSHSSLGYQPKSTSTSQEATPRGDFNQLSSRFPERNSHSSLDHHEKSNFSSQESTPRGISGHSSLMSQKNAEKSQKVLSPQKSTSPQIMSPRGDSKQLSLRSLPSNSHTSLHHLHPPMSTSSSQEATPRADSSEPNSSRSAWSDPPLSGRQMVYKKSSPRATVTMYDSSDSVDRHSDTTNGTLRFSRENLAIHSGLAENQLRKFSVDSRDSAKVKSFSTEGFSIAKPNQQSGQTNDGDLTQRSIVSDILEQSKSAPQPVESHPKLSSWEIGQSAATCIDSSYLYRQSEFGARILQRAQNNIESMMATNHPEEFHKAMLTPATSVTNSADTSPRQPASNEFLPTTTSGLSEDKISGRYSSLYRDQASRMVSALNSTVDALRKEVDRERCHASSLEGILRDLREQIGTKDMELCQLRDDLERKGQTLSELDTTMARMASSWEQREAEIVSERSSAESRVEELIKEMELLKEEIEVGKKEKEKLLVVLKEEKDRFSQATTKLLSERGVLCSNLDQLTSSLNSETEHLVETRTSLSATCDRLEEANLARDKAQAELADLRVDCTNTQRRLDLMERSLDDRRYDETDWENRVRELEDAVNRAEEETRRWKVRTEELAGATEGITLEGQRQLAELRSDHKRTEADVKARFQQQLASTQADYDSERGRLEASLREAHRIQIRELNKRHAGELARMRERAETEVSARMVEAETRVRELEIRARRAEDRMDAWRRDKCTADAQKLELTLSQLSGCRSQEVTTKPETTTPHTRKIETSLPPMEIASVPSVQQPSTQSIKGNQPISNQPINGAKSDNGQTASYPGVCCGSPLSIISERTETGSPRQDSQVWSDIQSEDVSMKRDSSLVIDISPDFSGFFSPHHFDNRTLTK